MTTEERQSLLDKAQATLKSANNTDDTEITMAYGIRSMAASLLVIADCLANSELNTLQTMPILTKEGNLDQPAWEKKGKQS